MKKTNLLTRSFLLSISLLLIVSNNYTTTTLAQDKIPPSIILRTPQTYITLPCAPGSRSQSGCCGRDEPAIYLTSEIKNSSDGSNWTYRYEVSGGRIIGSGEKVKIDFSEVKPGTYTVTVYATTSQKKKTHEVIISDTVKLTVLVCSDCEAPHICPKISIEASENLIKSGETLIFIGVAEPSHSLTYDWTVSAGTITKGQGTHIIYVDTSGLAAGQELTATLSYRGAWDWCKERAISTVKIK